MSATRQKKRRGVATVVGLGFRGLHLVFLWLGFGLGLG